MTLLTAELLTEHHHYNSNGTSIVFRMHDNVKKSDDIALDVCIFAAVLAHLILVV